MYTILLTVLSLTLQNLVLIQYFIKVCLCMHVRVCATTQVWKSEDNLFVLFSHLFMGPGGSS